MEAKLSWEPNLSFQVAAGHREEGFDAGEKLLRLRTAPSAVLVAAGDVCATGVILALKKNGVDVPRQVSVVGFDDQPFRLTNGPRPDHGAAAAVKSGLARPSSCLRQAMASGSGAPPGPEAGLSDGAHRPGEHGGGPRPLSPVDIQL